MGGLSLAMNVRRHCPSCHHRLSPLALECPVCGLNLQRGPLPRPLLFQASALGAPSPAASSPQVLRAPALGRVSPVEIEASPVPDLPAEAWAEAPPGLLPQSLPEPGEALAEDTSFWPLVLLEVSEAGMLVLLNLFLAGIVLLGARAPLVRTYQDLWPLLLPFHVAVSWAALMVPLVLTGQTLLMVPRGLALAADLPERRIAFSLLHLLSVLAFPVSFLCLLLTPEHRTLAELLSGLEILQRPAPRLR